MNLDEANRAAWGQEVKKHQLLYPDERVVVFLASKYPDIAANASRSVLDVGFGSGRHLGLLMDYGFQAYGLDYAREAVEVARSRWKDCAGLREVRMADLAEKPYPDGFFDLVLWWGGGFLRPIDGMARDLQLVNSLLGDGGRLLVNFRTKENWFFGKGERLSDDTYLLDKSAGAYEGMCYTFLDSPRAARLLEQTGFRVENSERVDLWKRDMTEHHSWWVFWAQKSQCWG